MKTPEPTKQKYRFRNNSDALSFWAKSVSIGLSAKEGDIRFFHGEQSGKTVTIEFLSGALDRIMAAAREYQGKEVKSRKKVA